MNLYAIEDMLYSYEEVERMNKVEEIEYDYIEPELLNIGSGLYIITDNEDYNLEIIKYIDKGIYKSLAINEVEKVKSFLNV